MKPIPLIKQQLRKAWAQLGSTESVTNNLHVVGRIRQLNDLLELLGEHKATRNYPFTLQAFQSNIAWMRALKQSRKIW